MRATLQISKGNKTALIFGASGLIGRNCLAELLISNAYSKIIIFGRQKVDIDNQRVEQHVIDFENLTNYKEIIKGNDLYCCLGTSLGDKDSRAAFYKVDFQYINQIADISLHNKINQFLLVSAVGANPYSLSYYNRVKGNLEEAIKQKGFWALHIFQPSPLIDKEEEERWSAILNGKVGRGIDNLFGGIISTRYKPIEAQTVAISMLKAAQGLKAGTFVYNALQLEKLAKTRTQNFDA